MSTRSPNTTATADSSNSAGGRALIVVDVQPTFCEGGELPVDGGHAVAAAVATYLGATEGRYDAVVTTQDWHIDPGPHFSTTPDYVDSWPVHGQAGTPNADLHPEVAAALASRGGADVTVRKGQHAAAYSGFEGTTSTGTSLAEELLDRGISAVDVCGIAESHCVRDTALDALLHHLRVRVLTDLTVPVTAELGASARAELAAAGAELCISADAAATLVGPAAHGADR